MHQVRAGESVWSISHKYGISMNDFIKWNKIKNNLIHPGQQVIIKQPASTSKPAPKPSTPATYKVKAGDSVWGICEKYGLSVSKFVQWNKIKNNTIHPGQVMHLQEPKPASKPALKTAPTTNTTYTVKAGDSVWLIANMHGISMNDLVKCNKIKNNTIHPGQKLTVKQPVSSGKPTTKLPTSTNPVTHKVSYGESLWLISSKYGVTVDELRKQNGLKGDLIHPGQVLVIKKGTTTSHSNPAGKSGISYTVKAGDSVWLIANRYGVSMDDLMKWNKIKNYTIHPGQVLTIQTIVSTPTKPAITTTPKVEVKPAITTTPKLESQPGVTTTPKVDEKPAITTTPKVEEQPVITTVPKTESEVLVEKASGSTGTVWDDIKGTQPPREGTTIPKSFEINVNGEKLWVNPNGTKHMVEYSTRNLSHGQKLTEQQLLRSFQGAVEQAISTGIKFETKIIIDNWELIFSPAREVGQLPVIKHAVYLP